MTKTYPFRPDYAVPPGATLRETLDVKGLSQADLALRTGISEKTISQIVHGIAPISYETAEKLELVLGIRAAFWNAREQSYREALVRLEESKRLKRDVDWLAEIPLAVLVERGYVRREKDKKSVIRQALRFFGVSSVEAWRNTWIAPAAHYRGQSVQEKRPGYVAAWLRMGELQAEQVRTDPFDAVKFRNALSDIRKLTLAPASEWTKEVVAHCTAAGVAVVLIKEIPAASVSGATRWLAKDKALIQLSLKYKTDDQVWFTFFHEAGHILLHGKRRVFVESAVRNDTEEEQEADSFARDFLIPSEYAKQLPRLRTRASILEFARSIGIAPGVVVGRLQHDGLVARSACNGLKRKVQWPS